MEQQFDITASDDFTNEYAQTSSEFVHSKRIMILFLLGFIYS
jgi:hypothetical protein